MVGHTQLKLRMGIVGTILFALYLFVGWIIFNSLGGGTGALIALSLGFIAYPFILYKFGRWSALRSVGAEDMPEQAHGRRDYGRIHQATERLCEDMGLDKPRLMVADMGTPNAFAVGRKADGVVVISNEIIDLLDDQELDGVIAHELAHIKNRDTVVMVMGQSLAALVGWVVYLVMMFRGNRNFLVAWLGSMVAQMVVTIFLMAISRYREYVADEDAARYTNNPDAMARALEKISAGAQSGGPRQNQQRQQQQEPMRGNESVSALCIFNVSGGILSTLFATHPPSEKRIERLRNMNLY